MGQHSHHLQERWSLWGAVQQQIVRNKRLTSSFTLVAVSKIWNKKKISSKMNVVPSQMEIMINHSIDNDYKIVK